MRSGFAIPKGMRGFPARLRAHGFYTSNNVKTDYNTGNYAEIIKHSWDDSSATAHWRKRPDKAQPFFSIFNLMTSHQSRTMVWPYDRFQTECRASCRPVKSMTLPRCRCQRIIQTRRSSGVRSRAFTIALPRWTRRLAPFCDSLRMTVSPKTRLFLQRPRQRDAPSQTRVARQRYARAADDSFPQKMAAPCAPGKPGTTTDRLVSFVDYAPTVLSLTGTPIPEHMQGKPFLGDKADGSTALCLRPS